MKFLILVICCLFCFACASDDAAPDDAGADTLNTVDIAMEATVEDTTPVEDLAADSTEIPPDAETDAAVDSAMNATSD